jgi:TetR/AcrR family transcriptional repressor of lmrAB and yxaGH operons
MTDARRNAIRSATRLFQRQGYHGTGLQQIYRESGAPKGSFYFHFPGGKEELAVAAIEKASRDIGRLFDAAAASTDDPVLFTRTVGSGLATWLERSGFTEGCPLAILTLETTPHSEVLTRACQDAFATWEDRLVAFYRRSGIGAAPARRLATLLIAGLEGALLLCRAKRSTRPFAVVAREIAAHVQTVVAAPQG